MLQDLLQKLEGELKSLGGGGISFLDPEEVRTVDASTKVYSSRTTNQRDRLRKNAMGVLIAVSRLVNALAPINKLPPEILGLLPKYEDDQTPKHLVAVSSVCSYWRNTFIATPYLWTRLDGRGVEKSRAWVERSGALPIQLWVEGSPNPEVLEFLATHSSRLEVVHLPRIKSRDRSLFTDNHIRKLLRPALILRHICVEVYGLGVPDFDAPVPVAGLFPSLERLRVSGFPVLVDGLCAPNLRNLELAGGFDPRFDPESLLDLLETSPLLEYLDFALLLRQDVSFSTERKVTLEKVKQASFSADGFNILEHLLLPTSNEITVDIPPHRLYDTTNDCTLILSRALDSLPMSRQVRSMSYFVTSQNQTMSLEGPYGKFELILDNIDEPTTSITLLRLLAQRSTGSIRELKIPQLYVPPSHYDVINDLFKSLEGLHSVHVHSSFATQCLLALGTNHCLQLEEVTIRCTVPDYDGWKEFVQGRSEAGIPIQRLFIERDRHALIDEEATEPLREYVREVHEMHGYR